ARRSSVNPASSEAGRDPMDSSGTEPSVPPPRSSDVVPDARLAYRRRADALRGAFSRPTDSHSRGRVLIWLRTGDETPRRRVAATGDLHGYLPEVPACDVLLITGDMCPVSNHTLDFQRRWLEGPFAAWLRGLDAGTIVGIAGNHDFVAEADPDFMRGLPW